VDLKAGQIVTVEWRKDPNDPAQDPHPPEPNNLRPAVVVQDTELFDPSYPTVLVVPMTGHPKLAMPDLTIVLQPTATNGCKKVSFLLPQNLTCAAKTRITEVTGSHITASQLQQLRQLIGLTVGAFT
jgi:mRNA-degrading endonuclease toxin of MazEF toxin-antitoxin module